MRHFKLQTAPVPDAYTKEGEVLTKLPYPIVVDENGFTLVDDRASSISRVIGFTRDLAKQVIDLWWFDVDLNEPNEILGFYVIVQDKVTGKWATLYTALIEFSEIQ